MPVDGSAIGLEHVANSDPDGIAPVGNDGRTWSPSIDQHAYP